MPSNEALKVALSKVRERAEDNNSMEEEVRMPVNIPVSYKNKLKVMAAVEETTMKQLILEALDMLFSSRKV